MIGFVVSKKRVDPTSLSDTDHSTAAKLPPVSERFVMEFCNGPHPATLSIETLLKDCELRTQSRGGPGGQHRNRTSSGAFLHHVPSGIVGEATERRSQAQNREVVTQRLRYRLAVFLRTASVLDQPSQGIEAEIRQRFNGHPFRLNEQNEEKPAVLALVMNDIHASGGQPSLVAEPWGISTSRIVALLKSHPTAFTMVNRIREHHGRGPLK